LIVVITGILLVTILVVSRKRQNQLYFEQQQMTARFENQLMQSRIEVQEETFRHVGKELHDNIGQLLSSTKMLIGLTERGMNEVPSTLSTANETISHAITEVRSLSRSLDQEWLEQFNFIENLQTEINRVNAGGSIKAELHAATTIDLKPSEQIILFRMAQEAIQNAIRHAEPSRLQVDLARQGDKLVVRVINDGRPLPPDFHGMGTNNMKSRAQLFGGTVNWISREGETEVQMTIPVKASNE